jgi:O-antigen/teichoic acid export membrane protein
MTFGSRILFGGLAAWFSRGVNILLGFILMPLLFRHLSKDELGIWLLIGQSWAALGIFDFGFGVILTRRIAFAAGQARKHGTGQMTEETMSEIRDLFATGQRAYRLLSVVGFGVAFGLGATWLRALELDGVSATLVWAAWGALCVGQAVGLWAAAWTCLLQGLGYVGWDGIAGSFINCMTLLAQIVLVLAGGGLLSLAIVAAVGSVSQRWLVMRLIRVRNSEILDYQGRWRSSLFRTMLSPAFRAWLTSLGYLLVANTDQLFIAAYQGAGAFPAYRAAFVMLINLHLLAGVFSGASPAFVSQLWQRGGLGSIRAILRRNALVGLLAMGCGGATILVLGPTLFEAWLGPGNFIGYPVVGIIFAAFILEHHANVFSTCGRATNDEAYAFWSLAAGILKVALAYVLTTRLGLAGLALSTLLAQSLTTSWFMVYRSVVRLGVDFGEHSRNVLAPVVLWSAMAFGVGTLLNTVLREQRAEIRVATVCLAAGTVLTISIWGVVLDRAQRRGLLRQLGVVGTVD